MFFETFVETLKDFSLADALDVAVVAFLLYSLLRWFKKTRSAFVAKGIVIFVLLYFLAYLAKMQLTTWIFQGFFAVFLIALVVIFQEELRSFFERVALLAQRRGRSSRVVRGPRLAEDLVRTLTQLGREQTGAIVVLKGRDPLGRYLEGGYDLDGEVSGPILASIFDPHSEGHDGAVIIDENRITRFAVHLPLSREFRKLSTSGTRHAAALGLAERTDAMCLVVSEERGTISIAQDGTIGVVEDPHLLHDRIVKFLAERASGPVREPAVGFFRRNPVEKGVALLTAVTLWFVFVQDFKLMERAYRVPVQLHQLPPSLQVESIHPNSVQVRLAGLKRDFRTPEVGRLGLHLNLRGLTEEGARRFYISEDNLTLPAGVRFVEAEPMFVEVHVVQARRSR